MLQSRRPGRGARSTHRGPALVAAIALGAALAAAWPVAPASAVTTATFLYTGTEQKFVVPAGVTSVHVVAVGGRGGNGLAPGGGLGGAPSEVSGDLAVFPGQTLYVEVAGVGTEASSGTIARGFNGGDYAGMGAAGGGGASDVRLMSRPETDTPQSLFSRLIVAAGGGGGGEGLEGVTGGAGGRAGSEGAADSTGAGVAGGAGTEESGGIGACIKRDCDGTLGNGGQGNVEGPGTAGGGGGGGLFGGAGGTTNGKNTGSAGGGGGSSLQPLGGNTAIPAAATAPEVQISYTPPAAKPEPPPATVPSNAFTLLRPIVGGNRSITLVLDPAGAGTLTASATAVREVVVKKHGKRLHRKARFTFGTARTTIGKSGALELAMKPTATGRRTLAAHTKLAVVITVSFTPTGGTAATKSVALTLPRR